MSESLTGMARVEAGMMRVAQLQHLPGLLAETGLPIEPLLDEIGLPHNALSHPENTIPVAAGARLLALCAERSQRPHFGLMAGQKVMPASLGLIGMLILNSPTVGQALRGLILTLHLNGRAVVPSLIVRGGSAALSLAPFGSYGSGSQQVTDFTIAVACNLMRALCGPRWTPSEVQFAHRAPDDQRPYRQFFKAPLRFSSEHTALLFPETWLAHHVSGADPQVRNTLQHGIAAILSQQDLSLPDKVRRALLALTIQGDISVEGVATMLGMHRRTLNRRLAEHGATIARLVGEVRAQLAQQLLSDTTLPMIEIAAALNYTDAATFARAFRSWMGVTPSDWRNGRR
jgi:AraC-like DNA-binding protein